MNLTFLLLNHQNQERGSTNIFVLFKQCLERARELKRIFTQVHVNRVVINNFFIIIIIV
jgi:hypothetical protein